MPPRNPTTRFLAFIVVFLLVIGLAFMGVLWYAKEFYPREKDTLQQLSSLMPGQSQDNQPFWKRLFTMERESSRQQANRRQGSREDDENVRAVGRGMGNATGHNLSPEHLALRELTEAQVILHSQSSMPQEEVVKTVRSSPIQGPFRSFEEKRFASRLLLMNYLDDERDPRILAELQKTTLDIAGQPEASFEEFFHAGIASLLAGDARTAETWLAKAEETWPARGRSYGNTYLFLMIAKGINGEIDASLEMLDSFQATFPDWLYIETFMPDLDDLETVYPGSGMLKVVKGYAYSLVFNQAAALDAYKKAIATGDLNWRASRQVAQWIQEIEEARDR